MSKKNKKKNKRRNKNKKRIRKPDDYFSFGPIEGARFGNINVLRSNFSDEQFEELQIKLVERFPDVCNEIDDHYKP